jgi:hypothetical protein
MAIASMFTSKTRQSTSETRQSLTDVSLTKIAQYRTLHQEFACGELDAENNRPISRIEATSCGHRVGLTEINC